MNEMSTENVVVPEATIQALDQILTVLANSAKQIEVFAQERRERAVNQDYAINYGEELELCRAMRDIDLGEKMGWLIVTGQELLKKHGGTSFSVGPADASSWFIGIESSLMFELAMPTKSDFAEE